MQDKGYPYPLYSLDLYRTPSLPLVPGFSIEVPDVHLCVQPALLHEAKKLSTVIMHDTLAVSIAQVEINAEVFSPLGLDEEWAGNLRRWAGVMHEREQARLDHGLTLHLGGPRQGSLPCETLRTRPPRSAAAPDRAACRARRPGCR